MDSETQLLSLTNTASYDFYHYGLSRGLSDRDMGELRKLLRKPTNNPTDYKYSYETMRKMHNESLNPWESWTEHEVLEHEGVTYVLRCANLVGVLAHQMRHPLFQGHLDFRCDPQVNEDGLRFYDDMNRAKYAETLQRDLGEDKMMVGFVFYSDHTTLDGMGSHSRYGVHISLTAHDEESSYLPVATPLVAYIPILEGSEAERGTDAFRQLKSQLLHRCLEIILAPIIHVQHSGFLVCMPDGNTYRFYPRMYHFSWSLTFLVGVCIH